ncbi:MAG: META and DUF4377 domain-containing protein [Porticoccaceae bacterium]
MKHKPPVKHALALSSLLALALAACTEPEAPNRTGGASSRPGDFHWLLEEAKDARANSIEALLPEGLEHRLQLDLSDGRLGISGGCNQISGAYRIEGDTLHPDQLVQTMMACEPSLMVREAAIRQYLEHPLTLQITASSPPLLTLTTRDGDQLTFTGVATAETRFGASGETVFLEVQPQRGPCHHPLMADYQCLQVRDVHYDDNGAKQATGDWQFLYQEIEGYEHVAGIRNILRLKRFELADPPADGSSIAYVLDMTVESERVTP